MVYHTNICNIIIKILKPLYMIRRELVSKKVVDGFENDHEMFRVDPLWEIVNQTPNILEDGCYHGNWPNSFQTINECWIGSQHISKKSLKGYRAQDSIAFARADKPTRYFATTFFFQYNLFHTKLKAEENHWYKKNVLLLKKLSLSASFCFSVNDDLYRYRVNYNFKYFSYSTHLLIWSHVQD